MNVCFLCKRKSFAIVGVISESPGKVDGYLAYLPVCKKHFVEHFRNNFEGNQRVLAQAEMIANGRKE